MLPNKNTENWQWSDFTSFALPQDAVLPQTNGAIGEKTAPLSFEVNNGLIELNQANALLLKVEKSLSAPLELTHSTGQFQFSLTVAAGAEATLIERSGDFAINGLTQIKLEAGAKLKHYRFLAHSTQAQFFHSEIELNANSTYEGLLLTAGAACQRIDNRIKLCEKGALARIGAGIFLNEGRHSDFGAEVFHLSPETQSYFQARALVQQGQASFRPTGFIAAGAEETQLHQLSKGMLLSDQAQFNSKPELAIHNDNVECSHGVASGALDAGALLYLYTRGLNEKEAQQMLLKAFMAELVGEDEIAAPVAQANLDKIYV